MPSAIPLSTRLQIIAEKNTGKPLVAIACERQLSYGSVCRICKRYQQQGAAGLAPLYHHCGRRQLPAVGVQRRCALWLKRHHPLWGAGMIRLQLQAHFEDLTVVSVRTLQRWFKAARLQRPSTALPAARTPWARQVHDVWQVDAKEKIRLTGGQRLCYLTLVDERSGILLNAFVFPPLLLK